jgi:anti-sigma regulatory factor (Ser/Thr protein kinase)
VQQLVAAAGELAANAFAHAGGPVDLTAWVDGDHVVFQLEDEGFGIVDPGVGYQPPYAGDDRWGLWLVRRRTDLLEVGRSERGTVVRLRAPCNPRGPAGVPRGERAAGAFASNP